MEPIRVINKPFGKSASVSEKSGVLRNIRVKSKSASAMFLLYFDLATPASPGAVPDSAPVPIQANGFYESETEFHFEKGLQIHASSTEGTLTAIGADELWITVHFEK